MFTRSISYRFICICKRDLYQKLFTWRGSILIAMSLWVICGLLEMPNYFGWGGHTFDPKTMACSYDRTANYTYTLFFVLVAIGPPLVVVCCCYINIFLKVNKKAIRSYLLFKCFMNSYTNNFRRQNGSCRNKIYFGTSLQHNH